MRNSSTFITNEFDFHNLMYINNSVSLSFIISLERFEKSNFMNFLRDFQGENLQFQHCSIYFNMLIFVFSV